MSSTARTIYQTKWIAFFVILSVVLTFDACRKMESGLNKQPVIDYSNKFFQIPATTNSTIKRIAAAMEMYNKQGNYVNSLAKHIGLPVWDKSPVTYNSVRSRGNGAGREDTLAFIPLIPEGKDRVVAFLGAIIDRDSIKVVLFNGNEYTDYGMKGIDEKDSVNSMTVAVMHMYLEHLVVEKRDTFIITDPALFYDKENPDTVKALTFEEPHGDGRPGGQNKNSIIIEGPEVCETVVLQYTNWGIAKGNRSQSSPTLPGEPVTFCYTPEIWTSEIEFMPGMTIGPDAGINHLNEGVHCTDPGMGCQGSGAHYAGWHPLLSQQLYHPYSVDTVGFGDGLKTVFPCVYHFIKDSLMNSNTLAQQACMEVFKDSIYMTLSFDTSTTATTMNDPTGITIPPNSPHGAYINPQNGHTQYNVKITLNPWFLRNATKEYMISTVLHEMLHAAFSVRWDQYQKWLTTSPHQGWVDSSWMKEHYANYWEIYTGQNVNLENIDEHQIMATDYFNIFNESLQRYYNKAASSAVRDSMTKILCYDGLHATAAWKELPVTQGIDTCEYKAKQSVAERSITTGTIYPEGCSGYNFTMSGLGLRAACQ